MNENYRHTQILSLLSQKRLLSTQEMIDTLAVSPATVRRDINKLSEQGKLRKVRNGAEAIVVDFLKNTPKAVNNEDEKRRIAEAASQLCEAGSSVLLTCGSTMLMLGSKLCGRKLQIMTNYLPLANYLINHNHEDIVIMGGQYNKNKAITLSLNAQNESTYIANIMFTSGRGFTEKGLFKTDMIIANAEKQMSAKACKYVVLLDSSKLGKEAGVLFTKLDDIDILITGKQADPNIVTQLREKGLEVILA